MRSRESLHALRHVTEFQYPESDGKPIGETDEHRGIILHLIDALRLWFRDRPKVYVTGNIMLYWVEGDANHAVSPDVFVVKGVAAHDRRVYKTWEEGKGPAVVIEVTSRSTKGEDLGSKRELYEDVLRVKEYYLYDPLREYLPRRLRAFELRGGRYVERRLAGGRAHSRELGLDLVDTHGRLRLVDPVTGRELPTLAEAEAGRVEAEAARASADVARARVEEENRRLREEIERLRKRGT